MKIFVATGGASHSDLAVMAAGKLAGLTRSELTLLTVSRTARDRSSARILDRAAGLVGNEVSKLVRRARYGHPGDEIVREAEDGRHDLIVLGERPLHRLFRRLVAPVGRQVVEQMPCPVLIARDADVLPGRVLICEAGRYPSVVSRFRKRLPALFELADEMVLMHVMSQMTAGPGVAGWELRAGAEELISQHTPEGQMLFHLLQTHASAPGEMRAKIRHGLVVDEIAAETEEVDYGLVVIGVNKNEGWEWLLFDDLARQIMQRIPVSTLIL